MFAITLFIAIAEYKLHIQYIGCMFTFTTAL